MYIETESAEAIENTCTILICAIEQSFVWSCAVAAGALNIPIWHRVCMHNVILWLFYYTHTHIVREREKTHILNTLFWLVLKNVYVLYTR